MKAAVVHDFKRPLTIDEVPIPEPGFGEVVLKVETSGLCHTDIHAAHGDWPVKPTPPFTPGHESVGVVERVGPEVKGVREGDRVAVPWLGYACGACRVLRLRRGNPLPQPADGPATRLTVVGPNT